MSGLAEETIAADEATVIAQFVAFLKAASDRRAAGGPRQRFNQTRAAACVEAEFQVLGGLPGELRVGLFAAPRAYRAWIRFANAASATDRERDIRGMSIRVFDVEGANLTPGANTQDFVLNSHPVMMAADTKSFLELLQANEAGGVRRALFFLTHPHALRVGMAARTNPTCHLDLSYWSTTPYLFGPRRAVKYVTRPGSARRSPMPPALTNTYLTEAIRTRLADSDAAFDFLVQFQTDSRRMPIEDASVEWKPQDSPYVPVARIRILQQSIDEPDRVARCEQTAFNPWHCLPEHRPLGSMNRARREIYRAMAAFRAETRR
jgi:hypothetical protein